MITIEFVSSAVNTQSIKYGIPYVSLSGKIIRGVSHFDVVI